MEREVRYCTTSDGVRIAYCMEGSGPALVVCAFFVESFALSDGLPEYRQLMDRFGRGRRLIRYDMRGTGLSQRNVDDVTLDALVRDLEAVADAAGLTTFALYGSGVSGPRAIAFAARHPERVSHLILYSTFARPADVMTREQGAALTQLARANWSVAAQSFADLSGRKEHADLNERGAHLIEQSTTADEAARLITGVFETSDVSSLLSEVSSPTLVLQSTSTQLFTSTTGQVIAAGIRDSRFVLIDGATNWLGVDAGDAVGDAVDAFLGNAPLAKAIVRTAAPPAGSVTTVLFTDLVGHTEMMQRLGDERGRAVLREHERITRETLKRHQGAELKTMGDGFMASFASVTSALECAIALQQAFADRASDDEPLHVRIGINAGEPIVEDGDLFGSTVIMASRIAAYGEAGDILIPEPVRHLLSGKGFSFVPRGDIALKGFELPLSLYAVEWHETGS